MNQKGVWLIMGSLLSMCDVLDKITDYQGHLQSHILIRIDIR